MKISRKNEYACLALIYLSENINMEYVKIQEIAEGKNIPKKYLEQILQILKRSGYVKSIRGALGGYKLAKKPAEISLAEIIRLIDGPIAPVSSVSSYFYEPTPIEQNTKLIVVFKDIRDYASNKLETTTFADLIGS